MSEAWGVRVLVVDDEPDVVVLDIGLPDLDGFEVCRRLRSRGDLVPVLMLTARGATSDKVTGLTVGADDYLPKPFEMEELLARLRALVRRSVATAALGLGEVLQVGDLSMDTQAREATRGGRDLSLTRTEFDLLEMFARHPRQVLSRGRIMEQVWGFDFGTTSNSLDVYVGYLRRKTEAGGEPRLLHTVRGVGYVLKADG
jgi:two-component system response regulator MprA